MQMYADSAYIIVVLKSIFHQESTLPVKERCPPTILGGIPSISLHPRDSQPRFVNEVSKEDGPASKRCKSCLRPTLAGVQYFRSKE